MRRPTVVLAAAALCLPVGAASAASEHRVPKVNWPPMSLAFAGEHLVYTTSVAGARPGGYTIFTTDTYRLALSGTSVAATRRTDLITMRTSTGPATAGPLTGGPQGRHLLMATGRGFAPHLLYCCRPNARVFPVASTGDVTAPTVVAAALQFPEARFVTVASTGGASLVTRHVDESPGAPFARREVRPLDAQPIAGLVAMSQGTIAWIDGRAPGEIRVATVAPGEFAPIAAASIPVSGQVLRITVSDQTVVALLRRDTGFEIVRHDLPGRVTTTVWTGQIEPGPIAVDGLTVVMVDRERIVSQVNQHRPGGPLTRVIRLGGRGVALATDGTRVGVVERRLVRERAGAPRVKRSIVRVAALKETTT